MHTISRKPIIIIAHSMGGPILLDALRYVSAEVKANIKLILFLNSPLSGHPLNVYRSFQSFYTEMYDGIQS